MCRKEEVFSDFNFCTTLWLSFKRANDRQTHKWARAQKRVKRSPHKQIHNEQMQSSNKGDWSVSRKKKYVFDFLFWWWTNQKMWLACALGPSAIRKLTISRCFLRSFVSLENFFRSCFILFHSFFLLHSVSSGISVSFLRLSLFPLEPSCALFAVVFVVWFWEDLHSTSWSTYAVFSLFHCLCVCFYLSANSFSIYS